MIELANRDDRIAAEMEDALRKAREKFADCDSILILMQRKGGGLYYETMPSLRLETLSFLATSFLHAFHREVAK